MKKKFALATLAVAAVFNLGYIAYAAFMTFLKEESWHK